MILLIVKGFAILYYNHYYTVTFMLLLCFRIGKDLVDFMEKLYKDYSPISKNYYYNPETKLYYSFKVLFPTDMKLHWIGLGEGGGSYQKR